MHRGIYLIAIIVRRETTWSHTNIHIEIPQQYVYYFVVPMLLFGRSRGLPKAVCYDMIKLYHLQVIL